MWSFFSGFSSIGSLLKTLSVLHKNLLNRRRYYDHAEAIKYFLVFDHSLIRASSSETCASTCVSTTLLLDDVNSCFIPFLNVTEETRSRFTDFFLSSWPHFNLCKLGLNALWKANAAVTRLHFAVFQI